MNNDSTKFNFVFIDDNFFNFKMVYVKIDNEFEVMGCKSKFLRNWSRSVHFIS